MWKSVKNAEQKQEDADVRPEEQRWTTNVAGNSGAVPHLQGHVECWEHEEPRGCLLYTGLNRGAVSQACVSAECWRSRGNQLHTAGANLQQSKVPDLPAGVFVIHK